MTEVKYAKAEKISLREYFNEKWLQNRIEEDTSIIGLGELDIVQRERKQSNGGRIDFLLINSEIDTMYEVEIQLGATDESHIIRTIEYWDLERRRFPSKEHKAVIVAENITNRFFNVISLMNRSIPIIAIQLNALKLNDTVLLNFTKVLDIYEVPADEEKIGGEEVGRPYWIKKSNQKAIEVMDEIIKLSQKNYKDTRITYNKHHIALGTQRQNFMWFYPRKSPTCYIEFRLDTENIDEIKKTFDESGLSYAGRKEDSLNITIQQDDLRKNADSITKVINKGVELFA